MSKQFTALQDNIFVKEKKQERRIGNMVIPDTIDADFTFGTVVSVGNGKWTSNGSYIPLEIHVGDEICFPRTMGQKINFVGDTELILVKESAVIAKVADVIVEDEKGDE